MDMEAPWFATSHESVDVPTVSPPSRDRPVVAVTLPPTYTLFATPNPPSVVIDPVLADVASRLPETENTVEFVEVLDTPVFPWKTALPEMIVLPLIRALLSTFRVPPK
jgi:hypothetical protein